MLDFVPRAEVSVAFVADISSLPLTPSPVSTVTTLAVSSRTPYVSNSISNVQPCVVG